VSEIKGQIEDLHEDSVLWADSVWVKDVEMLSSQLYKNRQHFIDYPLADSLFKSLDPLTIRLVEELDSLYIQEIFDLKNAFQKNTLVFKRRMQSYSFLASDLSFDIFLYLPKSYRIFINNALNVHPFSRNRERFRRARKIINELRINLNDTEPELIYFIEKIQFDLKENQISSRNFLKGSPTTEEEYLHNIIDVLMVSSRYSYR